MLHASLTRRRLLLTVLRAAVCLLVLLGYPCSAHAMPALQTSAIVLDGNFADWSNQPYVDDPAGDCEHENADLITFFFTTIPNDPTAYFMARRNGGDNPPIGLRLFLDTNNNGDFAEATDRLVTVIYQTENNGSTVDVDLFDGSGAALLQLARNADWGESRAEGAQRVEWGVSFAQLGIAAGQAIRTKLESRQGSVNGNPVCDTLDEIQWSPADALGMGLLAVLVVAGAGWMAYRRRQSA